MKCVIIIYELISFKSFSKVLASASSTEIKQNNPNFEDNAGIGQARNWEIFLEGMLWYQTGGTDPLD